MHHLKPLGYLLLLSFVGGSVSTLTKFALNDVPAFGFIFVRLLVGTIIAYLMLRLIRGKFSWTNFKLFAPIATFWWLNAVIFPLGVQRTTATTAQFIHIAIPIITAILAGIILRHKLTARQWLGVLVAALGVGMVVLSNGQLAFMHKSLMGNLIVLLSAVVFSIYAVGSRRERYRHLHAFDMIFIGALCGMLATLPLAVVEYFYHPWLGTISGSAWTAMMAASVVIAVFYGGFQLLINRFGPAYATLNLYLLPGFVIIWAGMLLHERPTVYSIAGAVIALIGVWVVTESGKRAPKVHSQISE